jgi:hypothetical protein
MALIYTGKVYRVLSVEQDPVVSLLVRFVGYYISRFFCVNSWEEETYFILLRDRLKSKGTFPISLQITTIRLRTDPQH